MFEYQKLSDIYDKKELKQIIYTVIILGISFSIAIFGREDTFSFFGSFNFFVYTLPTILIVLISILVKDMSQKFFARNMEGYVDYEMWVPGSIMAFLSSFLGVVIACAAGCKVYTDYKERFGRWIVNLTPLQMGLISMWGVFMYIVVGLVFASFYPMFDLYIGGLNFFRVGALINIFLALFSLIPLSPLDGEKLMKWSPLMWFMMLGFGVVFLFVI